MCVNLCVYIVCIWIRTKMRRAATTTATTATATAPMNEFAARWFSSVRAFLAENWKLCGFECSAVVTVVVLGTWVSLCMWVCVGGCVCVLLYVNYATCCWCSALVHGATRVASRNRLNGGESEHRPTTVRRHRGGWVGGWSTAFSEALSLFLHLSLSLSLSESLCFNLWREPESKRIGGTHRATGELKMCTQAEESGNI